jgi:hypothetical protein
VAGRQNNDLRVGFPPRNGREPRFASIFPSSTETVVAS